MRRYDGQLRVREQQAQSLPPAPSVNHGYRSLAILGGDVAHIDLTVFCAAGAATRSIARAALRFAAGSAAIALDLRDVPGGAPSGVEDLISRLLPAGSIHLLTFQHRGRPATEVRIEGRRGPALRDRPLYVLVNGGAASAAESCADALHSLGRATIVGTRTAGGANPGDFFPLPGGFEILVPTGALIGPRTGTNWEGVGVPLDVETDDPLTQVVSSRSPRTPAARTAPC